MAYWSSRSNGCVVLLKRYCGESLRSWQYSKSCLLTPHPESCLVCVIRDRFHCTEWLKWWFEELTISSSTSSLYSSPFCLLLISPLGVGEGWCVLLCFIPTLGNRYGPEVSSKADQGARTHEMDRQRATLPCPPFVTELFETWAERVVAGLMLSFWTRFHVFFLISSTCSNLYFCFNYTNLPTRHHGRRQIVYSMWFRASRINNVWSSTFVCVCTWFLVLYVRVYTHM